MGIEGQVTVLPQTECDQLRLELSGPDMGPIIGRRGDTLDAIQYLGSLVLNNALDEHVRLSVDTENYREKRAESLGASGAQDGDEGRQEPSFDDSRADESV